MIAEACLVVVGICCVIWWLMPSDFRKYHRDKAAYHNVAQKVREAKAWGCKFEEDEEEEGTADVDK